MANDALAAAMLDDLLNPFVGRVQSMLVGARAASEIVGLMLVHAGAIGRVEAIYGFTAGGRLSSTIAGALRTQALRKCDAIEMLSRDEFACVLRPLSSAGVAMLAAQRVMTLMGATPLKLGDRSELADIAIGIAMFPEHGADAETLLQRAKHALQTARGRQDRIWIYQPQSAESALDLSVCASRLRLALDQNTLAVHFMPQIGVHTGRLTGAEALLRWTDEVLGFVPPYLAVQAAEATGLMDRLTQWVITSAVQQCVEFQGIDPEFTVSVNVSPSNLLEPDLPLFIDRALRTWEVNGRNLVVEITESAMMNDPHAATEALHELKSYGVRLSIDDFGTGYSSMHYLAKLPLDELKIDLSFVRTMLEEPVNAKIVRSLIELAHNLDLSVVAEGVENEAIMSVLEHLNCDQAQGYHIGKAVPGPDLAARLRQQPQFG
jgi:EAL domain-containing protein (putative c-di-GMP-specific phosphodiesterase class I)/GGDEF domain-containing protein